MFQNNDIDIKDFVQLTSTGIKIADFVQVRSALITRYKSIYGNDIDLSTGTADGVFINDLALIINNILQSIKTVYSNLDVNTASGHYLDVLCRMSNISRKPATKSRASVQVTNTSSTSYTFTDLALVDKSGLEWNRISGGVSITLNYNESASIIVECSEEGQIKAPAGWIYQTLDSTALQITQSEQAIVGTNEESDSELRARRNQSNGAVGTTVLESLIGALREISGIEDVWIYDNNTGSSATMTDNTSVSAHSIYVIIRQQDLLNIPDETIGRIIYNKLTPGIKTTQTSDSSTGTGKLVTIDNIVSGIEYSGGATTIYWKKAKPIHPEITIQLTPFSTFTQSEVPQIVNQIVEYLNNIQISKSIDANQLLIETVYADPESAGRPTYSVGTITIASHTNTNTYYKYDPTDYEFDNNTITLGE